MNYQNCSDYWKEVSIEQYRKSMIGGIIGSEEYVLSLNLSKKYDFFPSNETDFKQRQIRAKAKVVEYKNRLIVSEKYIGTNLTAYEMLRLEGLEK